MTGHFSTNGTLGVDDLVYLVANAVIIVSYLTIAYMWWFRFPGGGMVTTRSMRRLIALMLAIDAMAYLLDEGAFFDIVFFHINIAVRAALAVVSAIAAITVVRRTRYLAAPR
jgi:hypothetical protein